MKSYWGNGGKEKVECESIRRHLEDSLEAGAKCSRYNRFQTGKYGGHRKPTPLNSTAYNGNIDAARLLLEKGANIETMRSNYGGTPLDSAAYNKRTDVARLLLEKGANIQATRINGATPLYFTTYEGQIDMVRLLLEKGAILRPLEPIMDGL